MNNIALMIWKFSDVEPEIHKNPSLESIYDLIERLDNKDVSTIMLYINDNPLSLERTKYNRTYIRLTNGQGISGILADTRIDSDERIEIYSSNDGTRMNELEYIEYTVLEEEALYVVEHYFKTGYLPPAREGTKWLGNLDDMIKS